MKYLKSNVINAKFKIAVPRTQGIQRRIFFTTVLLPTLIIIIMAVFFPAATQAFPCETTITNNITLNSDFTCSGNAITIGANDYGAVPRRRVRAERRARARSAHLLPPRATPGLACRFSRTGYAAGRHQRPGARIEAEHHRRFGDHRVGIDRTHSLARCNESSANKIGLWRSNIERIADAARAHAWGVSG